MKQVKITLRRSVIGQRPTVRKTVQALGLGRIDSSVSKEYTDSLAGMIRVIDHLVSVEESK